MRVARRERNKSEKRQSFESVCRAAGLRYCFIKAGLVLCEDPAQVGERDTPRQIAVVRLKPFGVGLPMRDVEVFRWFVELGAAAYLFAPEHGFVPVSQERLEKRVPGALLEPGEQQRIEASAFTPQAAAPAQPPAAAGATVDQIPAGTELVSVRDALIEGHDFRVIRQDPYGRCTVGPRLVGCCSSPDVRFNLHRAEGGCREIRADDVAAPAAGQEG